MAKSPRKSEQDTAATTGDVTCVANSPLKYNGERYGEGDTVMLPQSLYDELKVLGVVNPPEPGSTAAEKPAQ
jgi:hypothetical protein